MEFFGFSSVSRHGTHKVHVPVQLEISDFGFELQDSSNFKISKFRPFGFGRPLSVSECHCYRRHGFHVTLFNDELLGVNERTAGRDRSIGLVVSRER